MRFQSVTEEKTQSSQRSESGQGSRRRTPPVKHHGPFSRSRARCLVSENSNPMKKAPSDLSRSFERQVGSPHHRREMMVMRSLRVPMRGAITLPTAAEDRGCAAERDPQPRRVSSHSSSSILSEAVWLTRWFTEGGVGLAFGFI